MTLRTRVTLAAGLAVLVVVAAVSVVVYFVVRGNLRAQIDQSLSHGIREDQQVLTEHNQVLTVPRHLPVVEQFFMQAVDRDGGIVSAFGDRPLPVTADVLAVARGQREEVFFDADVDGIPVRVYVASTKQGTAVELGRSLTEVEQALRELVYTHIAISVVAVALAAVIGRLVAATATGPVHRVAEAAERVALTGELSHHIAVPGGDDLGRLAVSFNTMLDALSGSLAQQRQLVADASHELRTPLATVRTNVEVLSRVDELTPDDRAMLIADTVAQIGELTRLVGDLVELARGDGQEEPFTIVDLDDLTRRALDVARRNHPNLIDNAAKWSAPGAEVEIAVLDGTVTVIDHGPGVDPADLAHVFDRFYRSPDARTMPGSGLGLAIVKQVADSHRGTVTVVPAPGGGARFVLRFPTGP